MYMGLLGNPWFPRCQRIGSRSMFQSSFPLCLCFRLCCSFTLEPLNAQRAIPSKIMVFDLNCFSWYPFLFVQSPHRFFILFSQDSGVSHNHSSSLHAFSHSSWILDGVYESCATEELSILECQRIGSRSIVPEFSSCFLYVFRFLCSLSRSILVEQLPLFLPLYFISLIVS
ncbi:MAG: hypothetical protein JOS17DRAFT_49932 [Linnemannia elongata]|nr:MAG: hypothetical protein JOS17DRAFT_49932 [Linnemannia elongata]